MDQPTQTLYSNLWSDDADLRYAAFTQLLETTKQPVDWADDVWDDLVDKLSHADNHTRAIAAQLLANLAISDKNDRMRESFPRLLAVSRDPRFVTARHTMQTIWRVGLAGDSQLRLVLDGMSLRFRDCAAEKNSTLIRSDIITGLKQLFLATGSEDLAQTALDLIETADDEKYRKKYTAIWRKK